MSQNFYSEINLHIVWHTKTSSPLLTPSVEPIAHRYLKKRIIDTPRAFVHEIGGTETHIHLAVTIPPTIAPSTWMDGLKHSDCQAAQAISARRPTRRKRRA